MFEDLRNESNVEAARNPGNRIAEEICRVGYQLAHVHCQFQRGEAFVERRATEESDQDYVYRARWYLSSPEFTESRSDLIFYRESDNLYRLQIMTREFSGIAAPETVVRRSVVDERQPLEWWIQAIRDSLNVSDNVLDNDDPFINMRRSINFTYSMLMPRAAERVELQHREEMLQFAPDQVTQYRWVSDMLREQSAVALYDLMSREYSLAEIAAVVNFHQQLLTDQIEGDFESAYLQLRGERLDASAMGETVSAQREFPLIAGVSIAQLHTLSEETAQLSEELSQKAASLSWIQKNLPRRLSPIYVSGPTAARLILCMNAYNHELFHNYATQQAIQLSQIEQQLPNSSSLSFLRRDAALHVRNAEAISRITSTIADYLSKF